MVKKHDKAHRDHEDGTGPSPHTMKSPAKHTYVEGSGHPGRKFPNNRAHNKKHADYEKEHGKPWRHDSDDESGAKMKSPMKHEGRIVYDNVDEEPPKIRPEI